MDYSVCDRICNNNLLLFSSKIWLVRIMIQHQIPNQWRSSNYSGRKILVYQHYFHMWTKGWCSEFSSIKFLSYSILWLAHMKTTLIAYTLKQSSTLPLGKFFMLFCRLLILFSKPTFSRNSFRNISECQTDWIQIRPDILSGPDLGPNCLQR